VTYFGLSNKQKFDDLLKNFPKKNNELIWENMGGQLMPKKAVEFLKQSIKQNKITCWDEVHHYYEEQSINYNLNVLQHSINVYCKLNKIKNFSIEVLMEVLQNAIETKTWLTKNVYESREKDYTNSFRKMVYDTNEEMNNVLGKLEDNSFIKEEQERLKVFVTKANGLIKQLKKS
jgi:glucose-6-phosphate isomerase